MDYKELSSEYIAQYKMLSFYIKGLRLQLKNTKKDDDRDLYRRISVLYSMCLELKHIGEYLGKVCSKRDDI